MWSKIKALLAPSKPKPVVEVESVPCYICSTSVRPGKHICTDASDSVFTRYLAVHRALKKLIIAIDTNSLTEEGLEEARKALRLT